MNAFLKNFVRIAFISIGIGIILIVIAYSMNKSVFDKIARDGFNLLSFHSDWADWDSEEFDNDQNPSTIGDKVYLSNSDIIFPSKSDQVEVLNINMFAGTVSIVEGNEFKLQVNGVNLDSVKSEFSNGVWNIEDNSMKTSSDNGIRIFGINVNSSSIQNNIGHMRITLPKDFVGKKISLKCGAGTIDAEKIMADEVSISVGAGSCEIDELIAKEKSDFTVGAGEIIIKNITAFNAKFNCSMGSIYVKGILKGDSAALCSMGTIKLVLEGSQEDYNFIGKSSMGTVSINDNNYTGINQSFEKDNGAENEIEVNCNVGTVNLRITE